MINNFAKKLSLKLILGLSVGLFALAAQAAPTDAAATAPTTSTGLQKNLSFEDLLVQGKYQFSDESVVTVEQDKILDSLLGVRKDFQDRIKQSATRY